VYWETVHLDFRYTFFLSMALSAKLWPRPLNQFRNNFSQPIGLLGQVISPSQSRYLSTGQHRINAYTHTHTHTHTPNIHALSGIRTHDPRVRASEDSPYLILSGYCDRLQVYKLLRNISEILYDILLPLNFVCSLQQKFSAYRFIVTALYPKA
jgi:hypothetical protein